MAFSFLTSDLLPSGISWFTPVFFSVDGVRDVKKSFNVKRWSGSFFYSLSHTDIHKYTPCLVCNFKVQAIFIAEYSLQSKIIKLNLLILPTLFININAKWTGRNFSMRNYTWRTCRQRKSYSTCVSSSGIRMFTLLPTTFMRTYVSDCPRAYFYLIFLLYGL